MIVMITFGFKISVRYSEETLVGGSERLAAVIRTKMLCYVSRDLSMLSFIC